MTGQKLSEPPRTVNKEVLRYTYCISRRDQQSASISCWTPMFIPPDIWMDAVKCFRQQLTLAENINQYLLPRLKDPEALFRLTETIRPLEAVLIDHGILCAPITIRSKHLYYFDETCVYRKIRLSAPPLELRPWHQHSGCLVNRFLWPKPLHNSSPA